MFCQIGIFSLVYLFKIMSTVAIAFKNRKLSDSLNRKLEHIVREGSKYDVDLVSANGHIVQAHRLILSMYSKNLRRFLSNSSPDVKIIVPLIDIPYAVLEKVVELFYCGEIRVLASLKAKVYKALTFLEVDIPIEPPRKKPLQIPDFSMVDGQLNLNSKSANDENGKSLPLKQTSGQQPQQQKQQSIQHIPSAATDDNARVKSVPAADALVVPNGIVSQKLNVVDSSVNDTSILLANGEMNNIDISANLLYNDDVDGDIEQLEKTVNDLCMDIGITELNAINADQSENGQTQ